MRTEKEMLEVLSKVNTVYSQGYISTLGGKDRASASFTFCLEPKEDWVNGILENSDNYFKVHWLATGELQYISGPIRLRKTKAETADQAATKIIKAIAKHKETK